MTNETFNGYVPASFNQPPQKPTSFTSIGEFLGVDFTNSPANVDPRRSPNAVNMVRDEPGKVRKSMGYQRMFNLPGKFNGIHYIDSDNYGPIIHVGEGLYRATKRFLDQPYTYGFEKMPIRIYKGVADNPSTSVQMGGKLYILDGKCMMVYNPKTTNIQKAEEIAHIPTIFIGRRPGLGNLGGRPYESLNLINGRFAEEFLGNSTDTIYQMSISQLDPKPVIVKVMKILNGEKVWVQVTNFFMRLATGEIIFEAPVGPSPVQGEDNVRIEATKTMPGYADRINKCTLGKVFGVKGAADRIFVSGNPTEGFKNVDWYSERYDGTYFPDTSYAVHGNSESRIIGYSMLDDRLAIHKDANETGNSILLREGVMEDGKAAFPVCGSIGGVGAVSPRSFAILAGEPVYLTPLGVYAITSSDTGGEKHAQNRSFYLNGRLLCEPGLENACACVYKDMYVLLINGKLYILDGLQPFPPERSMPYSTRQYAGFYRTGLDRATHIWLHNDRLFFGTDYGTVFRFYNNPEDSASYYDIKTPITARWETPDFDQGSFWRRKTFRRLFLRMGSATKTGVDIQGRWNGQWHNLAQEQARPSVMSFGNMDFNDLNFDNDPSPAVIAVRLGAKRTGSARFAFENSKGGQPFKIYDIGIESRDNGEVK